MSRYEGPPAADLAKPLSKSRTSINRFAYENVEPSSEIYRYFLAKCPLKEAGRAYLHSRGFLDETIAHFKIGQVPIAENIAQILVAKFGFEQCKASGLLSKVSTSKSPTLTFRRGYLVFPIFKDKKVVSLQARTLEVDPNGPKFVNLTGKHPQTFNADALECKVEEIAVCEGIPDIIAAHQLGWSAIGLLGVSNSLNVEEIANLKGKRILLMTDWDASGETKAKLLRHELSGYGLVCVRISQPDPTVKDLNDYLKWREKNVAA